MLQGARKSQRPLSTKMPIHLVIKASHKNVFRPTNRSVENLIAQQCKRFGITLYKLTVNWSHLHLLIKIEHRDDYVKFIKSLTSLLSQKVKGHLPNLKNLFTLRPFTRVLSSWGKEFKSAIQYHALNQLEAMGFERPKKKRRLKKLEYNDKNHRRIGSM